MKDQYKVIKRPVITEKTSNAMGEQDKYTFEVDGRANKIEIRKAVESKFKVKVSDVNVLQCRGKLKRVRWQTGKTPDWKKAVVTLKKGEKIELTTA